MEKQELLKTYQEPIPVLDHGFVRLVDVMGDDNAIVQMARVSYGEGTKKKSSDTGLIRYLMRHRHTSPFEGCEIKLHCKMPIFIARQWIRHRTASVNEVSARYSTLPDEMYLPELGRIQVQSSTNKQGSGAALDLQTAEAMHMLMEEGMKYSRLAYDHTLNHNVARELARINLPVATYTEWYWKIDLHNLLHFLRLRADSHAQHEIQVYAQAIGKIVRDWVPITWDAYTDYQLNDLKLTGPETEGLISALKSVDKENFIEDAIKASHLKGREEKELRAKLDRLLPR